MARITLVTDLEDNALICQSLASLVGAGLNPLQAWQHVVSTATVAPHPMVVLMWGFCSEIGAPVKGAMHRMAQTLTDLAAIYRQAQGHLVGPRAARKLVMSLPPLSLLLAALAGYNSVPFLFGTVFGWILMIISALLLWAGSTWTKRLITAAEQAPIGAGLFAQLVVVGVKAGFSVDLALEYAQRQLQDFGEDFSQERSLCLAVAQTATMTGASTVDLIESVSTSQRSRLYKEVLEKTEKLAVSLTVPLGLCVLPAFICVGIIPIVFTILSSTALQR